MATERDLETARTIANEWVNGIMKSPEPDPPPLIQRIAEALDAARAEEHNFLLSAIAIINWMSGSDDFGPGGKAHNGWLHWQSALEAIRARAKEAGDDI